METLEVHSKDFLVKWVHADNNSLIDWQIKPLKKSINFSIYRQNNVLDQKDLDNLFANNHSGDIAPPPTLNSDHDGSTGSLTPPTLRNTRLRSSSVASVNKITDLNSSIYKTKSRSTTFSSHLNSSNLTLVKDYNKLISDELVRGKFEVEKDGMYAFVFDNSFSKTTGKKVLFSTKIVSATPSPKQTTLSFKEDDRKLPIVDENEESPSIMRPKNGELLQGVLLKRRRKKLQGFVKRFFILNNKYGTLSYFRTNDNKLRGQMPIIHSIVSAYAKTKEIIIDSGMEVWDLKALNDADFDAWVKAFNEIKKSKFDSAPQSEDTVNDKEEVYPNNISGQLEAIATKLDRLKLETTSATPNALANSISVISNDVAALISELSPGYKADNISVFSGNEFYDAKDYIDAMSSGVVLLDSLGDKDRNIIAALSDDEDEDEDEDRDDERAEVSSSSSSSASDGSPSIFTEKDTSADVANDDNLYPLPHEPVTREYDIPICNHEPPSILGFVRKNVGKDLSSIAMPVDMNEPVTILQKYAELMEYCDLINNALLAEYFDESGEKILRIAAFAVSYLSSMRMKERNSRKPFNPLLGETFELVREDFGIRLISEKVSHRPLVFAMHVESEQWTFSFSPCPSQKFWGKNAEISTKGTAKLVIRGTGETFTWSQPNNLLKNIIAGEKYTEPVSTMTIKSSSGQKAVVEFAKGGMFSGRSEDLKITAFSASKAQLPYSVAGKWTESLTLKTNTTEKLIWTVGELLPQSEKKFGFTKFAGTLNKITEIEKGYLPPTDSRTRPDIKYYEAGDLAKAEELKNQLEEAQRQRRKELETSGQPYRPSFFHQVDGTSPDNGEWVYTPGENSYWNRRKLQNWNGLPAMW